jgi:hypothetical protein
MFGLVYGLLANISIAFKSSTSFQRLPISHTPQFAPPQAAKPCGGHYGTALHGLRTTPEQVSPLFRLRGRELLLSRLACRSYVDGALAVRSLARDHDSHPLWFARFAFSFSCGLMFDICSYLALGPWNSMKITGLHCGATKTCSFKHGHPDVPWRPAIIIAAAAWRCIAARIDDAERRSSLFRAAAAHFTEIPAVKLPTLNSLSLSR